MLRGQEQGSWSQGEGGREGGREGGEGRGNTVNLHTRKELHMKTSHLQLIEHSMLRIQEIYGLNSPHTHTAMQNSIVQGTNFPYNTQHRMECSNRYVCMYIGNLLFVWSTHTHSYAK